MQYLTIIICLLLSIGQVSSQDNTFSANKLKKDFNQLVSTIEAHPSPYRHITEEDHARLVREIKGKIKDDMSVADFYKLVSPALTTIKDGHTSLIITPGWLKKKRKLHGVFPYKVYLSNENELYFLSHFNNDDAIPPGSKIISMNGVPTETFLNEIDPWVSYERHEFRNAVIQDRFEFYLLLYFGNTEKLSVEYLSNSVHKTAVKNIPYDEWKDQEKSIRDEREKKIAIGQPYSYKKIGDKVGLINIFSFSVGDFGKFEFFLRKTFGDIKDQKIEHLIIDIRGNYGGYPKVESALLHYITKKTFKTMAKSEAKVSKTYRNYFQKYIPNYYDTRYLNFFRDRFTINIDAIMTEPTGTILSESAIYKEETYDPVNFFNGDIYVLTDRRSYSASSSFAAIIQCYQLGYIIGSETGGTKIFHANSISIPLNNTRMTSYMATTRKYTSCFFNEDDGIRPDIEFIPSIFDLVSGKDAQLNYALHIIRKVNKQRQLAAQQQE